jgi:hypothetical protein
MLRNCIREPVKVVTNVKVAFHVLIPKNTERRGNVNSSFEHKNDLLFSLLSFPDPFRIFLRPMSPVYVFNCFSTKDYLVSKRMFCQGIEKSETARVKRFQLLKNTECTFPFQDFQKSLLGWVESTEERFHR